MVAGIAMLCHKRASVGQQKPVARCAALRRFPLEPEDASRLMRAVTIPTKLERIAARATRLRREALNCVALAVSTGDTDLAAQLIDEAARLRRRSDELANASH